jgi:vacuolar-type H+-ATPase subunit F/Vma7
VCADEDRFQVYICEGPRQITVIVFTPPPKDRAHEPVDTLTEDEPIWVVKVHDQDDEDVKAKVRVVVPDDKAPIIVHQLKYRPNQPN